MSVNQQNVDNATCQAMRNLILIAVGTAALSLLAYMGYLGYEVSQRGFVETFLR